MNQDPKPGVPGQQEEEYEPDLLTLEDEEGTTFTFEVIDAADFNDIRYLMAAPYFEDPEAALQEDAEVLIFKAMEQDGEEFLDVVSDDEELLDIGQRFTQRLKDLYDIDLDALATDSDE